MAGRRLPRAAGPLLPRRLLAQQAQICGEPGGLGGAPGPAAQILGAEEGLPGKLWSVL